MGRDVLRLQLMTITSSFGTLK